MTARRTLFSLSFVAVLLLFSAAALRAQTTAPAAGSGQTHAVDLFARGSGERYWVCVVAATDAAAAKPFSVVRQLTGPVAGTWADVARIDARVYDAAPVGDRLAVLLDDGDWKLLWEGGSTAGPRPPPGARLTHLAGDGDTLWGVAVADKSSPLLLRWSDAAGWARVTTLPPEADVETASVGVYDAVPWLAWVKGGEVRVAHFDGTAWVEPFRPLARAGAAAMIAGAPFPTVATLRDQKRLAFWRPDVVPPQPFPRQLDVAGPEVDVTSVGPSLRVVSFKDGQIVQTTIDDAGRGQAYGPDVIAAPPAATPRTNELFNLLILGGLTAALLATLRNRQATPSKVGAAAGPALRVCPPGRRSVAALIDLTPVLATLWFVYAQFDGSAAGLQNEAVRVYLPVFASVLVYLAHVTVGELWTGRSIGKRLLGLRVLNVDGTKPAADRIFLRNLLRAVEVTLPVIPVVCMAVSPLRQRVGDIAARTVVVIDQASEVTATTADGGS